MRKILFIMSFMFLFVFVAACGNQKVDGEGKVPADIPVEWATAMIQKDQATRARVTCRKMMALCLRKRVLKIMNTIRRL